MIRKIIKIDTEKCTGCGLCVDACHEGAIGLKNGKAVLLRDDYCDGLGDCLPACPENAISFEEREAAAYDEQAVAARMAAKKEDTLACGCPGSTVAAVTHDHCSCTEEPKAQSHLANWPVQLRLVPVNAPYLKNADLLIAADCTAYACGSFHQDFIKDRVTIIACPKLDPKDYADKFTALFKENAPRSITVTRMTVPCCSALVQAVDAAVEASGLNIPVSTAIVAPDGSYTTD